MIFYINRTYFSIIATLVNRLLVFIISIKRIRLHFIRYSFILSQTLIQLSAFRSNIRPYTLLLFFLKTLPIHCINVYHLIFLYQEIYNNLNF